MHISVNLNYWMNMIVWNIPGSIIHLEFCVKMVRYFLTVHDVWTDSSWYYTMCEHILSWHYTMYEQIVPDITWCVNRYFLPDITWCVNRYFLTLHNVWTDTSWQYRVCEQILTDITGFIFYCDNVIFFPYVYQAESIHCISSVVWLWQILSRYSIQMYCHTLTGKQPYCTLRPNITVVASTSYRHVKE